MSAWEAEAACWVETTTLLMRTGLPSMYSKETWVLPSGRKKGTVPSLRTLVSCWESWWAQKMGAGMRVGVSLQAKPNIMPWSPAPWSSGAARSTPWAMSGDWWSMEEITAQVSASKPMSELV